MNNNPWLEVTKQKEQTYPNKLELNYTISNLSFSNECCPRPGSWVANAEKAMLAKYPATPKDCLDKDDLFEANSIIDAYFDDDLEEFIEYCFNEYRINSLDANSIWSFLFINIPVPKAEDLVKYLYETNIW